MPGIRCALIRRMGRQERGASRTREEIHAFEGVWHLENVDGGVAYELEKIEADVQ
jgi:hypothetical protein